MSNDLLSIRLLLVAATGPSSEIWQQAVAQVSVPVQFDTADGRDGAAALRKGGVDLCIVDDSLPKGEISDVVEAARAAQPSPFVVIAAPRGSGRVNGADVVVRKPDNPAEARKLAELCARVCVPVRTLVVDDSATTRGVVRKILGASRFTLDVHEASEGAAALEQLRGGNFGIVFLDYNMPGLNGLETLSEIRREKPDVAVVMMTAAPDDTADRVRRAGALGFLKKPFYPADVDAVLERYYGFDAAMS